MEQKSCMRCQTSFLIDDADKTFYEKMKVPTPNVCPDCRFKMRALFRNEMTLYSGRTCDLCQKSIVTMYNPKSPYTIYCYSCFYSEKWDPRSFATEYDFSRTFFEQLHDLFVRVPKSATYLSLGGGVNVNSEYTNMASACKDCYLIFNSGPAEEVLYARGVKDLRDSMDLYFGIGLDRCYEGINIQKSSGIVWGQNCVGCVDSFFVLNCSGVTNCFGCVNLRNKSYCWFNEQLTHEEYELRIKKIMGSAREMEDMCKKFFEFVKSHIRRENSNIKTIDSTGDYLFECKSVRDSFEVTKAEDCRFIFSSKEIQDSIGTTGHGIKAEQLLECTATGFSSHVIGSYGVEHSQNILHGFYISNCKDSIGCDALKNGQYAVFNKEYSKEDYEKIREHIVKELTDLGVYGLMMPPEIAPFAYNETIAMDNMPMTKEEALAAGFRWEDDIQMTKGKETMLPEEIPDHIRDVQDSITSEILRCGVCERNYKITTQELAFYKKMTLPIPRKCFYCRHHDRVLRRGPYKFWNRECAHCGTAIVTNYAPERPEIIYCEKCYQQEVI